MKLYLKAADTLKDEQRPEEEESLMLINSKGGDSPAQAYLNSIGPEFNWKRVRSVREALEKQAHWPEFALGRRRDLLTVAKLRDIAIEGVELTSERGFLRLQNGVGTPAGSSPMETA